MSASMLGMSFTNPETRFDDLFHLHHGTRHNHWPLAASHSKMEEMYPFSFGRIWQPYTEDVFAPYQQKQSPESSSPMIVDEETRHGFFSHFSDSGSTPSQELHPTIYSHNDTVQPKNTDSAVDQVCVRFLDGATGFGTTQLTSSFQKLQVSTHNHLRASEVSSSSFNPFSEYDRCSVHPLATQRSMEHTPVSTMTDESDSLESEEPTDLSVPKNVPQDLDNASTAIEHPHENADAPRGISGGSKSPLKRLTYTHLSDISNDSEEDSDENPKTTKTHTSGLAKKRFEKLVPYQLALPWISTSPVIERPNIPTFDPVASYAQMVIDPAVRSKIASYILWLLQPQLFDKINELSHKVPKQKQKQKIVELKEDGTYEHNDVTHNGGSVADEHVLPAAEEYEVIDLTQDDDDDDDDEDENYDDEGGIGDEQLHVQPPTVCPPSDQQLVTEAATVEQTIEQKQHNLDSPNAKPNTQPVQGPTSPALLLKLPPEPRLASSTITEDSIMSPAKDSTEHYILSQPFSSQNSSAQQNYYFSPPTLEEQRLSDPSSTQVISAHSAPIQTSQKRPYREPEPTYEAVHCSGPKQLRRSPRLQAIAKESTCANAKRNMWPQTHQKHRKSKPADQKAQGMTPLQAQRSVRLKAETRKCAPATEKRSREPWNNKRLSRFVAQNAINLPRHVWVEQKEGEPRRSMRLAKKMQCRRYFLRPRLQTKS